MLAALGRFGMLSIDTGIVITVILVGGFIIMMGIMAWRQWHEVDED